MEYNSNAEEYRLCCPDGSNALMPTIAPLLHLLRVFAQISPGPVGQILFGIGYHCNVIGYPCICIANDSTLSYTLHRGGSAFLQRILPDSVAQMLFGIGYHGNLIR